METDTGYPLHRENGPKRNPSQGNTRNLEILPNNTGKTQGIVFAQVVNSLILKAKDISIFATNIPNFIFKLDMSTKSVGVCNSHKSRKLAQGKFAVRQGKNRENTGNLKCEWVP